MSVMAISKAGVKRNRNSCHNALGPRCGPKGGRMKKRSGFWGLGVALLGAFVLLNSLGQPRIEHAGLHGSDILRLVASGMAFGVALVMLLGRFRSGDE